MDRSAPFALARGLARGSLGLLGILCVAAVVGLLAASDAFACPVCVGGNNQTSKDAFVLTTVVMSAVPLASIGGLVYYVVARVRRSGRVVDEDQTP